MFLLFTIHFHVCETASNSCPQSSSRCGLNSAFGLPRRFSD